MKILAVCGMGLGSALLLRMLVEKAVKKLNLDAQVTVADISTARGAGCTRTGTGAGAPSRR